MSAMQPEAGQLVEARWWRAESEEGRLLCYLCPRYCRIGEGQAGFCFIRKNVAGRLYALAYGRPSALNVDPIEKKPLFHFMPGSPILSIGTAGCNLACKFCQNWEISKSREDQVRSVTLAPAQAVAMARREGCPALAYTYNEPTIWAEYAVDISRIARVQGLKTVMVTDGYVTLEALDDIYDWIDAANVDLKAFTEDFYRKITLTHLEPVLESLKALARRGVWIEITNLIIPTLNDDMEEVRRLAGWILANLGPDYPLHFTAFHPDFKLRDLPATPHATLHEARAIALRAGLHHVYEGNVHCEEGSTTYCPSCGSPLIRRRWHRVEQNRVIGGKCPCGRPVPGYFPTEAA